MAILVAAYACGAILSVGQTIGVNLINPRLAYEDKDAGEIDALAYSPLGKWLAAGYLGGYVRLRQAPDWNPGPVLGEVTQVDPPGDVSALAFSRDGVVLAVENGHIEFWDVAKWKMLHSLAFPNSSLVRGFSPDLRLLATIGDMSDYGKVFLWTVSDGRRILTLDVGRGTRSLCFSYDGTLLATGNYKNTIDIWNAATGHRDETITAHDGYVEAVAFSPDGRRLASGGTDKNAKLWEVGTGRMVRTYGGFTDSVRAVRFNADGTLLAIGSGDTVSLRDVESGREISKLPCSYVAHLVFSPDGRWLASGGGDGTLCVWDLRR